MTDLISTKAKLSNIEWDTSGSEYPMYPTPPQEVDVSFYALASDTDSERLYEAMSMAASEYGQDIVNCDFAFSIE